MQAQDIVNKLSALLPLYTDAFSSSVSILSIDASGSTATVTTSQSHGIINGQNIAITGVDAPVQIDVSTFLRTGSSAIFETLQDHDLTLSYRDIAAGGKTITISGANEVEFNGVFQLARVVNRRKLIIAVSDSGSLTMTGSAIVENANGNLFNGLFVASNVTPTTFDYMLPTSYPINPIVNGALLQTSIRILSVLDIQQYLQDVYTKKSINENVLVVQLGDVTQSKKRNENTDAASSTAGEYSFTPVLIQSFAIYIIVNVTDQLTASAARDAVESEYIPAIFKSVLRAKFNTGFTYSQYRSTFTGHGVYAYAGENGKNKALYVHEVSFEQLVQLCKADAVIENDSVAMRDIEYNLNTSLGNERLYAEIDLDEEPVL